VNPLSIGENRGTRQPGAKNDIRSATFSDYTTPRNLKLILQAQWSPLLKVTPNSTPKIKQDLSLPRKMG